MRLHLKPICKQKKLRKNEFAFETNLQTKQWSENVTIGTLPIDILQYLLLIYQEYAGLLETFLLSKLLVESDDFFRLQIVPFICSLSRWDASTH